MSNPQVTAPRSVTVVGGGLAGCEAALQLARRGVPVRLVEMKPAARPPAHQTNELAELVCSNSLRALALTNAVGLLKEELRRAGAALMQVADANRLPAGGALAVDRARFATAMTKLIDDHPGIERVCEQVDGLPAERPLVLATGPLTTDALAADLAAQTGEGNLATYDAIAPIVSADSIDWEVVWKQSRYDKGTADYVNCPLDREQYEAFVEALVTGDKVPVRPFEDARYFEGCLPCEVMAERGPQTLSHGPLKPVGLTDPHTDRRPHAVVQLRAEDDAATAYNLVGLQTRLTHPEQLRVFRSIPGLEQAEFLRLGSVHRNTFVRAPEVLDAFMQLKALPDVYVTGQLCGVEGYVESAAAGLLCGILLAQRCQDGPIEPPPPTTALGGLLSQLRRPAKNFQPSNITWAHFPPLDGPRRKLKKRARYEQMANRALEDITPWLERVGLSA